MLFRQRRANLTSLHFRDGGMRWAFWCHVADLWQLSPESQVGPVVIFCPGTWHAKWRGCLAACTLTCHCARSLPLDCVQCLGQASWLWLIMGPFPKRQVCYRRKTPRLSSWGAKRQLIFLLGCVKSILKKPTNLLKKSSGESCIEEIFSAIDVCISWLPTVLPAYENLRVCTEAEFAYEARATTLLPTCGF